MKTLIIIALLLCAGLFVLYELVTDIKFHIELNNYMIVEPFDGILVTTFKQHDYLMARITDGNRWRELVKKGGEFDIEYRGKK